MIKAKVRLNKISVRLKRYFSRYKHKVEIDESIMGVIVVILSNVETTLVKDDTTYYAHLKDTYLVLDSVKLHIISENYYYSLMLDNGVYAELQSRFIRRLRKDSIKLQNKIFSINDKTVNNILLNLKK